MELLSLVPLCEGQMAVMDGSGIQFRKMEQIFATFDANHDGALSKVRTHCSAGDWHSAPCNSTQTVIVK